MNQKEAKLYRIVDAVVACCQTQIDEDGRMSVTRDDVLGRDRRENVVMTRCILVSQIVAMGYSVTTAAQLLGRTVHAVRHLLETSRNYHISSMAYRIAEAEATLMCKKIITD